MNNTNPPDDYEDDHEGVTEDANGYQPPNNAQNNRQDEENCPIQRLVDNQQDQESTEPNAYNSDRPAAPPQRAAQGDYFNGGVRVVPPRDRSQRQPSPRATERATTRRPQSQPATQATMPRAAAAPVRERPAPAQVAPARVREATPARRQTASVNPLRVMVLLILIAILVLLVVLIAQNRSLRNQRNELRDDVERMQVDYDQYMAALVEIDLQDDRIEELEEERDHYRAQLQALQNASSGGSVGSTTGNAQDNIPPVVEFPVTHTVGAGQTLWRLAILYYGDAEPAVTQAQVQHIMAYNRLTNDELRQGQVITIPAPPQN